MLQLQEKMLEMIIVKLKFLNFVFGDYIYLLHFIIPEK